MTYSGETVAALPERGTKCASILPASLSDVNAGDLIGVAATAPESGMVAQQVVISPKAPTGTDGGHYPWSMPALVAHADAQGKLQSLAETTSGSQRPPPMPKAGVGPASDLA